MVSERLDINDLNKRINGSASVSYDGGAPVERIWSLLRLVPLVCCLSAVASVFVMSVLYHVWLSRFSAQIFQSPQVLMLSDIALGSHFAWCMLIGCDFVQLLKILVLCLHGWGEVYVFDVYLFFLVPIDLTRTIILYATPFGVVRGYCHYNPSMVRVNIR